MTEITHPLSNANVAQCMAERDAEIERLRAALAMIADGDAHYDGATTFMKIARNALEQ